MVRDVRALSYLERTIIANNAGPSNTQNEEARCCIQMNFSINLPSLG